MITSPLTYIEKYVNSVLKYRRSYSTKTKQNEGKSTAKEVTSTIGEKYNIINDATDKHNRVVKKAHCLSYTHFLLCACVCV